MTANASKYRAGLLTPGQLERLEAVEAAAAGAAKKASNLGDLTDKPAAFNAIKQPATATVTGVVELATTAEVRASATGDKALTAQHIEAACAMVALTDAAVVAVDWDTFLIAAVTFTAGRTFGNPTNVQIGTTRYIVVKGSDATARTISFEANYKGNLPPQTVTSTSWMLIGLTAIAADHIVVTSCKAL